MTWKRSWRLSVVITTGRIRTKGWRATRRRKRRALESPNLPTSTITLGSRTVMGYSNCQSPHEWQFAMHRVEWFLLFRDGVVILFAVFITLLLVKEPS
jgi:hypothetical protein